MIFSQILAARKSLGPPSKGERPRPTAKHQWSGLFIGLLLLLCGCGGGSASGSGSVETGSAALEQGVVYPTAGRKMFSDYSGDLTNALSVVDPNPSQIIYDGNLYYTLTPGTNSLTINFFTNGGATSPAGSIVVGISGTTYPITYTCAVNVTGGSRPAKGTLILIQPGPGFQTFTLNGSLAEQSPTGPWGLVTWTFQLTSQSGLLTGSMSATNGTETVSLTEINAQRSGTSTVINGVLSIEPQGIVTSFSLTLNSSGAVQVALGDGVTMSVGNEGAASVGFANGLQVPFADIYSGV